MTESSNIIETFANPSSPARRETLAQLAKDAALQGRPEQVKPAPDPGESFFLSEFLRLTPKA